MSTREAVSVVEGELTAAGVPEPRTDAEILVAHVRGIARSAVYLPNGSLSEDELRELAELVARRCAREPLQYLLGEWGFRRLTLSVDGRALIPRPETEVVVERGLALTRGVDEPVVVDVGTGTGAIALALADECPNTRVVAVDASREALALARENARRTGFCDRVELRETHLLDGLGGPFDLVVSNPPYVRPEELEALQPEVRDWEPIVALVGEGLTEAIAEEGVRVLRPGGGLVLEVADGTALDVAGVLERLGYVEVAVTPDLAGRERVVEGRRPG